MEKKKSLSAIARVSMVVLLSAIMVCGSYTKSAPVSAEEAPIYSFNVIGDMQMGDPGCNSEENYKIALEDIKSNLPNTKVIVSVGDTTNKGTAEQYQKALDIKNSVIGSSVPMYLTIGNHDRGYKQSPKNNDALQQLFVENVKLNSGDNAVDKVYYSFQVEGYYYIVLGSEVVSRDDDCNDVFISDTQYNWFKGEMEKAAKTDKPIFVFIHEPFANTVSGSLAGQKWEGNPNNPNYYENNKYADLKTVADQYPKALVFSGHTHWRFSSKQPALISNGKNSASYFNCSAVGYIWLDSLTGIKDNTTGKWIGNEGLYVDVYTDKVVVRARDFAAKNWVFEKTVSLTGEAATATPGATKTPASAAPNTNTGDSDNTNTIIICVAAAVVLVAAIVVAIVLTSKKKKGS